MTITYPFIKEPAEYKRIIEDAERLRRGKAHKESLEMLKALARQF